MSVATNMLATAGIVTAGKWAKDETLDARIVFGGAVATLILAFVNESSPMLANRFSLLILVSAFFIYAMPIWRKSGLAK